MQQNKKIIIGIVVATGILIGGYLGYGYYLKYKKSTETAKEAVKKELTREESIKEFTTVLPDANKIELTEEQKEFAKPIATSSSPTKTDPEREKLIKEFTRQQ